MQTKPTKNRGIMMAIGVMLIVMGVPTFVRERGVFYHGLVLMEGTYAKVFGAFAIILGTYYVLYSLSKR